MDNSSLSLVLKIGNDNVSDHVVLNGSRRNWQAFYRVRDNDTGLFEWSISGIDRAGNALVMGQNLHSISSLEFDTYNENGTGYGYQADTRRPSLDNLSIAAHKHYDAFE